MSRKSVYVDGWRYMMPDTAPNPEGRIVLISKASLAPLERFEWGLDADNEPYEQYEWLEDDFFESSNYFKNITRPELEEQIENLINLFRKEELSEMATAYLEIQDWLNSRYDSKAKQKISLFQKIKGLFCKK